MNCFPKYCIHAKEEKGLTCSWRIFTNACTVAITVSIGGRKLLIFFYFKRDTVVYHISLVWLSSTTFMVACSWSYNLSLDDIKCDQIPELIKNVEPNNPICAIIIPNYSVELQLCVVGMNTLPPFRTFLLVFYQADWSRFSSLQNHIIYRFSSCLPFKCNTRWCMNQNLKAFRKKLAETSCLIFWVLMVCSVSAFIRAFFKISVGRGLNEIVLSCKKFAKDWMNHCSAFLLSMELFQLGLYLSGS